MDNFIFEETYSSGDLIYAFFYVDKSANLSIGLSSFFNLYPEVNIATLQITFPHGKPDIDKSEILISPTIEEDGDLIDLEWTDFIMEDELFEELMQEVLLKE